MSPKTKTNSREEFLKMATDRRRYRSLSMEDLLGLRDLIDEMIVKNRQQEVEKMKKERELLDQKIAELSH